MRKIDVGGSAALCGAAIAATGIALAAPSQAEIGGVHYSLAPAAERITWDDDMGLDDTALYGGRLSMNFGRFLGLEGYYLKTDETDADFSGTSFILPDGADLLGHSVGVENYGADVVFNLSDGNIVPFLKGGAGVLSFEPTGNDDFKSIALRAGGGLRMDISDRLNGMVYVENAMFRADRRNLLPADVAALIEGGDPDKNDLRHNLVLGAGLSLALGGQDRTSETELDRAFRQRYSSKLSGLSVPIQPFAGRVNYDDAFGLDEQEIAGVRAGADFGHFFGLRGYYWKGMESDFGGTDDVQSWGAEAQFNLSAGPGATPYLLVGAGQLDFGNEFTDANGLSRDDKAMLILGGGLDFSLGQRFDVNLSARDYVFSNDAIEEVARPDDLLHNMTYTVGLNFSFGGSSPDRDAIRDIGRETFQSPVPTETSSSSANAETMKSRDTASTTNDETSSDSQGAVSAENGSRSLDRNSETASNNSDNSADARSEMRTVSDSKATNSNDGATDREPAASTQVIQIPVPKTGEIYVRYGEAGAVSIQSTVDRREGHSETATNRSVADRGSLVNTPNPMLEELIRKAVREEIRSSKNETGAHVDSSTSANKSETQTQVADPAPRAMESSAATVRSEEGLTEADLEILEYRLADRFDEKLDRSMDDLFASLEAVQRESNPTTVVVQPSSDEAPRNDVDVYSAPVAPGTTTPRWENSTTRTTASSLTMDEGPGLELNNIQTFTGASLNSPSQWILGARADLGPISNDSSLRFVPEVAFGVDNNSSFLISANLRWNAAALSRNDIMPYLGAGFGVLSFDNEVDGSETQGVLNLSYGLAKDVGNVVGFVEHEGIDLFRRNRLLLGASWAF